MSSSVSSVTFLHPFRLPGMEVSHPAGTFPLHVEDVALDVSWLAYRQSITVLLPFGGRVESWAVTREDLQAALTVDAATSATRGGLGKELP